MGQAAPPFAPFGSSMPVQQPFSAPLPPPPQEAMFQVTPQTPMPPGSRPLLPPPTHQPAAPPSQIQESSSSSSSGPNVSVGGGAHMAMKAATSKSSKSRAPMTPLP